MLQPITTAKQVKEIKLTPTALNYCLYRSINQKLLANTEFIDKNNITTSFPYYNNITDRLNNIKLLNFLTKTKFRDILNRKKQKSIQNGNINHLNLLRKHQNTILANTHRTASEPN
jgi:hypothetical protein